MADLVTLAELKAVLDIPAAETELDDKLTDAIEDATQAIKTYTGRDFGTAAAGATKTYQYDRSGWLEIDDATSVTSVSLDGVALTANRDYVLGPDRGYLAPGSPTIYEWIELQPYRSNSAMGFLIGADSAAVYGTSRPYSSIEVVGTFGFPTIPNDVRRAAIWTAVEFATLPQPFSQATIGTYSVDQARAISEAIPPRAKELLAPFRRLP